MRHLCCRDLGGACGVGTAAGAQSDGAHSQVEINAQVGVKFDHADAELNTLYRDLMKEKGAPGQAKLRAAQQAWLKFRDAECEFKTAGTAGGSIRPIVFATCLKGLTLDRNQQLKALLTCDESDLFCGR